MLTVTQKNIIKSLLLIVCIAASPALSAKSEPPIPVKVQANPKVQEAMHAMKAWAKILGKAKAEGETLQFGNTSVNTDFTIVDGLKSRFGGNAAFFVKKGDGFLRISTNVMKDGKRAVGTMLDQDGPAIAAIKKGKAFYDVVDILGTKYDTGYEPVLNSNKEVIGIYYVGQAIQ